MQIAILTKKPFKSNYLNFSRVLSFDQKEDVLLAAGQPPMLEDAQGAPLHTGKMAIQYISSPCTTYMWPAFQAQFLLVLNLLDYVFLKLP